MWCMPARALIHCVVDDVDNAVTITYVLDDVAITVYRYTTPRLRSLDVSDNAELRGCLPLEGCSGYGSLPE
jgi:hypothetical protein